MKLASFSIVLSLSNVGFAQDAAPAANTPAEAAKSASQEAKAGTPSKQEGGAGTDFTCSMNSAQRTVKVSYEKEGSKVPCKVNYVRDAASGEEKVLYNATTEEGYCEKKASEFVEKLKSSGWTCATP